MSEYKKNANLQLISKIQVIMNIVFGLFLGTIFFILNNTLYHTKYHT